MTRQRVALCAGVGLEWVDAASSAGLLALTGIDDKGEPLFEAADVRTWIERGHPIDHLDEVC